jgi:hypothetical protein
VWVYGRIGNVVSFLECGDSSPLFGRGIVNCRRRFAAGQRRPPKKSGNELPHSKTHETMSACNATMYANNKSLLIDETTMPTTTTKNAALETLTAMIFILLMLDL